MVCDEPVSALDVSVQMCIRDRSNRDLPQLQGTVVYIALVFVVVNLVVDLSYALIDPRIRYGKGEG